MSEILEKGYAEAENITNAEEKDYLISDLKTI
jgi:hypothetical protein